MTHIEITFTNGSTLSFDYKGDIDFHSIGSGVICFDDMYINLSNVLYMRKEAENE